MTPRSLFHLQPFCDSVKFQKAAGTSLLFCKQGKISSLVCFFHGSCLLYSAEKYKVMKPTCLTNLTSKLASRKKVEIALISYTEQ